MWNALSPGPEQGTTSDVFESKKEEKEYSSVIPKVEKTVEIKDERVQRNRVIKDYEEPSSKYVTKEDLERLLSERNPKPRVRNDQNNRKLRPRPMNNRVKKCNICGKLGHIAKMCYSNGNKDGQIKKGMNYKPGDTIPSTNLLDVSRRRVIWLVYNQLVVILFAGKIYGVVATDKHTDLKFPECMELECKEGKHLVFYPFAKGGRDTLEVSKFKRLIVDGAQCWLEYATEKKEVIDFKYAVPTSFCDTDDTPIVYFQVTIKHDYDVLARGKEGSE